MVACRGQRLSGILTTIQLFISGSSSFRISAGTISRRAALATPQQPARAHVRQRKHSPAVRGIQIWASELDQDSTPLVDALVDAASNVRSPLFYPGHKMGR